MTLDADSTVTVTFVAEEPPPPPPPPPPTIDPGIDPGIDRLWPAPTTGQTELDKAVASLPIGRVVFNVPPTLELGEIGVIHLALSLRETHEQLEERITEIGEIAEGELRVSSDMRATLTGADFEIVPLIDERQAVSAADTTEWRWQVEPVETGVRTLQLTLYAFVSVGGKETTREVETFTRDLKIRVTWVDRVSEFASGNWQWLWTAILVPFAAFVMARRRGRQTA